MTSNRDAYRDLERRALEVATLGSCSALLGWDERTFLPPAGAAHRGAQVALLARIGHELWTDPRTGQLLDEIDAQSLTDHQVANLREWRRAYQRATKLPASLVEELARVTSEAQGVWQEAKRSSDFVAFRPSLEKIIGLKRQEADCVGYAAARYDALIDEFEPGVTTQQVRDLLGGLAAGLSPLVAEIVERQSKRPSVEWDCEFSVAAQEKLCREVASAVGFDFDRGRLDSTEHPFCSGMGPGDCRILTRFHSRRPFEAFFGTLHEAGHGLYEQGLDQTRWGTPCGMAASYGIHESQSRLWENQIGRSRPFWKAWGPRFRSAFSDVVDLSDERLWTHVNRVHPSLIRIDADEVTYNLHIAIRFELESAMLSGDLAVAELPTAWQEAFQRYLDLTVPDDARGCLQDIHWSFGGIGYFPTYTLGNLYSAQIMDAAEQRVPGLWEDIAAGSFLRLTKWLNENIHQHGQLYRPVELIERVTGEAPSSAAFLRYLRAKFLGDCG